MRDLNLPSQPVSRYWQHNEPLSCPKRHRDMLWLGGSYWLCMKCRGRMGTIYFQVPEAVPVSGEAQR